MAINYFLVDNPLTPDPNDYRAQVVPSGYKDMDAILTECLRRGTMVTKTDLQAVAALIFEVITDFASEGYNVTTPVCNLRALIKGVFIDSDSNFSLNEHEIKPGISAGSLLRSKFKTAVVEKTKAVKSLPLIQSFFDQTSGLKNTEITPGGMGLLKGSDLTFDAADATQGIFFLDEAGAETKVSKLLETLASKISFSVPETLTPGTYSLELRTTMGATKMRKADLLDLEVKA